MDKRKKAALDLISIDYDRCKRDCICQLECPFDLIFYDEDGYPLIRKAAKRECIACGHCVSVCPHDALKLHLLPEGEMQLIDPNDLPDPEAISLFLKSRRSIRSFRKKPVEHETLEWMLDLARYAPSAHNVQPVRWVMVMDPNKVQELAGLVVEWMAGLKMFPGVVRAWEAGEDKVLRNAPHMAIAHAPVNGESPAADCSIATTYMELAGHAKGVGGCWAGFLMNAVEHTDAFDKALGIPDGHRIYGALMLGYPKFRYRRVPERNPVQARWME